MHNPCSVRCHNAKRNSRRVEFIWTLVYSSYCYRYGAITKRGLEFLQIATCNLHFFGHRKFNNSRKQFCNIIMSRGFSNPVVLRELQGIKIIKKLGFLLYTVLTLGSPWSRMDHQSFPRANFWRLSNSSNSVLSIKNYLQKFSSRLGVCLLQLFFNDRIRFQRGWTTPRGFICLPAYASSVKYGWIEVLFCI